MTDDVRLPTSVDDDRYAAGGHRFDRGDAEVLRKFRVARPDPRRDPWRARRSSRAPVTPSLWRVRRSLRPRRIARALPNAFEVFVVLRPACSTHRRMHSSSRRVARELWKARHHLHLLLRMRHRREPTDTQDSGSFRTRRSRHRPADRRFPCRVPIGVSSITRELGNRESALIRRQRRRHSTP